MGSTENVLVLSGKNDYSIGGLVVLLKQAVLYAMGLTGKRQRMNKKRYFEIEDWLLGLEPEKEKALAVALRDIFAAFLADFGIDAKGKTTRNRYLNCLSALGSYLLAETFNYDSYSHDISAMELLLDNVDEEGAPLIFNVDEEEEYQRGVDAVCRKLAKYLAQLDQSSGKIDQSHL